MTGTATQLVVMGVSGSGKSTLGEALARRLGRPFIEGDRFHPPRNVAKMSNGIALDDADRVPWLRALSGEMARLAADGRSCVVACSALKRRYRDLLREAVPETQFVHIRCDPELVMQRLGCRPNHFFPASLLDSQLEALEPLAPDEHGFVVDGALTTDQQLLEALRHLRQPL